MFILNVLFWAATKCESVWLFRPSPLSKHTPVFSSAITSVCLQKYSCSRLPILQLFFCFPISFWTTQGRGNGSLDRSLRDEAPSNVCGNFHAK